jgi:uncharacterized membrane protein
MRLGTIKFASLIRVHSGLVSRVSASAVSIGSSLLGLLTGAGILNLIWIVVGAFVLYMFFKDEGVKAEFPS